jgi:hypothetical protein
VSGQSLPQFVDDYTWPGDAANASSPNLPGRVGFSLVRLSADDICEASKQSSFIITFAQPASPWIAELRLTSQLELASVDETWTDSALRPASSLSSNSPDHV